MFAVAMSGVHFAAKELVAVFGLLAGSAVVAVMYFAARYYERRP